MPFEVSCLRSFPASPPRERLPVKRSRKHFIPCAFTLVELLVVVAVITVLASLLLPALAKAKSKAQAIRCVSNLKQLQLGWHSYLDDNDDLLVPDNVRGDNNTGQLWSTNGSWVLGSAKTDITTSNIETGVLFPYVKSTAVYRCPGDRAVVNGHPGVIQTRSYSLNAWLNGNGTHVVSGPNDAFEPLKKRNSTEIIDPSPSDTFVFIEQNEKSISSGTFYELNPNAWRTDPAANDPTWWDLPSDRHSQAAYLSFADSHVGPMRWKWPKRFLQYPQPAAPTSQDAHQYDLQDLRHLQDTLPRS
jgi:prepilin-type N-terminal cleavage/methylation domain-containing protein